MPFLKINDADFYYEIHGKGHPLILIAGYTCDHTFWIPVLDDLSQHFQVLIFDNRGVGQTKDNAKPFTVKMMADDVVSLADHLQLSKPDIIGHSMGGTIAQTVAGLYPEKIRKLCILSSAAKWRQTMVLAFKTLLELRAKDIDFDLVFAANMPWIYGKNFLNDEKNIARIKKLILENPYPQLLEDQTRQFKVLEEFDGIKNLKNITAQTLVVHGIEDLVSLPYESEYMAKNISQVEIKTLACAHGMIQEVPQELTKVLVKFLQG